MLTRKSAWIEAGWIFLLSRLVMLGITIMAQTFPPAGQTTLRHCTQDPRSCLLSWLHFDVLSYAGIAQHGYSMAHDTVFFPLWPLLIRIVAAPFGGTIVTYYLVGLLLANLLFYLALVVLYRLLCADYEPTVARNALFYLSFAPYAFFFFIGYAESLLILLFVTTFFLLRHERWWLAGLGGFLAALTRSQGVWLVIPFFIVLLQRIWLSGEQGSWGRKMQSSLPLILIPLGVVVYILYLWHTKGDPLLFSRQEAEFWNRHLTFPPLSIIAAFGTLFHSTSFDLGMLNVLDLAFVLGSIGILVPGWRRLPLHYSLFALALILFSISYPQGTIEPLAAAPRYMLIVFPVAVVLAMWGKQPRVDRAILACSLPLLALNAVHFINHFWVA